MTDDPPALHEIPLFPLNVVLFPSTRQPLRIFEDRYRKLFDDSLKAGGSFGIVLIREGQEVGGPATPFDVGTLAEIEEVDYRKDSIFILCRGTRRFRIHELLRDRPYLVGRVELLPEAPPASANESRGMDELVARYELYVDRMQAFARSMGGELQAPKLDREGGAHAVAYRIASALSMDPSHKQELLETEELSAFIEKLRRLLDAELEFLTPSG